jgi:hypothetical protein
MKLHELTPAQLEAQVAFAAVACPAEVVTCRACDGEGGRERRGHTALDWYPCDICSGAAAEIIGQLPATNEMAARIEAALETEGQCPGSDLPDWARDLLMLSAATLRAADKHADALSDARDTMLSECNAMRCERDDANAAYAALSRQWASARSARVAEAIDRRNTEQQLRWEREAFQREAEEARAALDLATASFDAECKATGEHIAELNEALETERQRVETLQAQARKATLLLTAKGTVVSVYADEAEAAAKRDRFNTDPHVEPGTTDTDAPYSVETWKVAL